MAPRRTVVLSGGGSKGAFQVGALNYLMGSLGYTFDVVTGVSVGSLNASMVAQNKLRELNAFWSTVTDDKVYTKYSPFPLGLIRSLFGDKLLDLYAAIKRGYMYDSNPLASVIRTYVDPDKFTSLFRVGCVELNSGKYIVGTEQMENIVDYILASASMPIYFPSVNIANVGHCVDGGVRHITPLGLALSALKTLPEVPDGDEVWILLASPLQIDKESINSNSILDVLKRTVDVLSGEIYLQDLKQCLRINSAIKAGESSLLTTGRRYVTLKVVMPTVIFSDDLVFDTAVVKNAMNVGYQMAQTPLSNDDIQNIINQSES